MTKYKFGILLCKENQHDEDAIYSNSELQGDFLEFLHFVGKPIELLHFEGYSAGLDTKRKDYYSKHY